MRIRFMAAAVSLCLLPLAHPLHAASEDASRPRAVDIAIEPTHRGDVTGQVYDAVTGAPLEGASVTVMSAGTWEADGPGEDKTDAAGRYACKALIGRTSSNFDVGRAIASNPIAVLLGVATNRTKRVDVSRVTLRVTADRYRTFEGVVVCRDVQAARFRVQMAPVLLVPEGSSEVSTAAPGWGIARIADVTVEPNVVRPGGKMVVTALIASPPVARAREMKVEYHSIIGYATKKGGMKLAGEPVDGKLVFTAEIKAPKTRETLVGDVQVRLVESPYDVAAGGAVRSAVLQVTPEGSPDEDLTRRRIEAFRLQQGGARAQALAEWRALCAEPTASRWDFGQLAHVSRQLNETRTAADALRRVYELTPNQPEDRRLEAAASHAVALLADGEGREVVGRYGPVVADVKAPERPTRIPLPLMVALGSAHVQVGNLTEAESISQELLKWPQADLYAGTADFRNHLRLATARKRAAAEPGSPAARAELGRVMMDLGRWEEAIGELQAAASLDPALPTVQRDLSYALLHVQGVSDGTDAPKVADALSAAERQVYVTDAKGRQVKSKDFFAWHSLGLLLYARAREQQQAGDPLAQATMGRAREALQEALRSGRRGADVKEGLYLGSLGFFSGRSVAIAGFAYSQADSDFVLLDAMKRIDRDQNDYLAHYSAAQALYDLAHYALAEEPLRRALELKPGFVDGRYLAALIDIRLGRRADAIQKLDGVLEANPRHPEANLTLARLHTEEGDMPAAAAALAAHSRFYGAYAE